MKYLMFSDDGTRNEIVYTNELSHEWQRRTTLRDLHQGLLLADAYLDADHLLITAARFHGFEAQVACPVCKQDALRYVRWVYGDNLGRRSGTARDEAEIARLVEEVGPITVHLVEVCESCKWNFLLKEVTAQLPR